MLAQWGRARVGKRQAQKRKVWMGGGRGVRIAELEFGCLCVCFHTAESVYARVFIQLSLSVCFYTAESMCVCFHTAKSVSVFSHS